jgi:putative phosphoribosyl transferase
MMSSEQKERLIHVPVDSIKLEGALGIPEGAQGIVLFAHGSGSSRHSPRNTFVARILREHTLGTLLIDLLTREEDSSYEKRFDIDLLTHRLIDTTNWLLQQAETKRLGIGFFGASTGAAAALQAAATMGSIIKAVVSRGGRPDLASSALSQVQSPTLLIVGSLDHGVIELNQQSYDQMKAKKELVIVPGASHLFEEPGTLEQVAHHAAQWFEKYLRIT